METSLGLLLGLALALPPQLSDFIAIPSALLSQATPPIISQGRRNS